jgi:hypothetical protein
MPLSFAPSRTHGSGIVPTMEHEFANEPVRALMVSSEQIETVSTLDFISRASRQTPASVPVRGDSSCPPQLQPFSSRHVHSSPALSRPAHQTKHIFHSLHQHQLRLANRECEFIPERKSYADQCHTAHAAPPNNSPQRTMYIAPLCPVHYVPLIPPLGTTQV